jgi:tetratricopeptide (TPR) repeat protein
VRVTAQLIDARTDHHLWAHAYDRDLRDVLVLQDEVARDIANEIRIELTPQERAHLATPRPVNPDAYDAYIKGRSSLCASNTGDEVRTAIKYFEKAIELAPTYAASYAGLADAYSTQGFSYYLPPREAYPRAKAAAAKALALDENSTEAYASLCWINVRFDWDWQAAERNCTRALELDPNSGDAAGPASDYYFLTGRPDEGLALLRRSVERDPLSAGAHHSLGWGYFMSRRYDEAITALRQALALDPMDSDAWESLGHTYVEKKMYPEALHAYRREVALKNGSDAFCRAYVYGRAGEREKALKALEEFKQLSKRGHMPPGAFAFIYTGLGDKDQAFQCLEKAFEERDTAWFPLIKVSPQADPLRSDPRFHELIRRLGL